MLARDIMTESPFIVSTESGVQEVVEVFTEHRMNVVPVVDKSMRPVGLLNQKKILEISILSLNGSQNTRRLSEFGNLLIEHEMVREFEPLDVVYSKMLSSKSHRLLVVDQFQRIKGLISPIDILLGINHVEKRSGGEQLHLLEKESSELRQKMGELKEYLDAIPYLIASVNREGGIDFVNQILCNYLGYSGEDLVKRDFHDLFTDLERAKVDRITREVWSGEYIGELPITMRDAKGNKKRVFLQCMFCNDGDQPHEVLLLMRPVQKGGWHLDHVGDPNDLSEAA